MALTDIVICQFPDRNSPVNGPVVQQFPLILFGIDADGAANHDKVSVLITSKLPLISAYRGGLFPPITQPKAVAENRFGAVSDKAANPDPLYDPVVQ